MGITDIFDTDAKEVSGSKGFPVSKGHSPIGASSMERWEPCPGSVKLCKTVPPQIASAYAEEGTKAHDIAARILNGEKDVEMPDDFVEPIQVYVDYCNQENPKPDLVFTEHWFDLSDLHPELSGTADRVHYYEKQKLLRVIDLKFGKGKLVNVSFNKQLMYYALGALVTLNLKVTTVEIVVVQPRAEHPDGYIRVFTLTALELLDFKQDLIDAAKRTAEPNAPLKTGAHCLWCPASGVCPEKAKEAKEIAKTDFANIVVQQSYDPVELGATLDKLDQVEDWCKAVRRFAYNEAMSGRKIPGFKLVEKRAVRHWMAPDKVAEHLTKTLKFNKEQIFETPSLKSPAQMEKLLKEKNVDKKILSPFIESKSNGLTLADELDSRPEVNAIHNPVLDFEGVDL